MDILGIIGWAFYALLLYGLLRLSVLRERSPRGLERLDYRR